MSSLLLKGFVALLANTVFFAIRINLSSYTGGLITFGANNHNLAGIDCALCFDNSRRVAGFSGLNVFLNLVKTLNNNLTLFRANLKYLAGFGFTVF